MFRTLGFRFVQVVVVLVLVTFGTTALTNLIPGQPAYLVLGNYATPAAIAQFNRDYGFNLPLFDRYWHWVTGVFHGSLGMSIQDHEPVTSVLKQALPPTIELAIITLSFSLILAITLTMISLRRPRGIVDQMVTGVSSALVSVPAFISAVLFVYIFSVAVHVFPPNGWVAITQNLGDNLKHAALPVITLSSTVTPLLLRVFRGDLVKILQSEYVASARSRGLPEWYVFFRYAFRPASLSLLTISGIVFGYLFGGSIIVESFYAVPGIGLLVSSAELGKDIPVVQGVIILVAVAYLTINILVDLGQTLIDPRMRKTTAH